MISSPAFCVLSLSARRVLDRLEVEMASHGGTDNGKLPVTFSDFRRYGIDYDAIAPAIREVVALGFVEVTKPGRAGNAEYRLPNIFRLTYGGRLSTMIRPMNGGGSPAATKRRPGQPQPARASTKITMPVGENRVFQSGKTNTPQSGKPLLLYHPGNPDYLLYLRLAH